MSIHPIYKIPDYEGPIYQYTIEELLNNLEEARKRLNGNVTATTMANLKSALTQIEAHNEIVQEQDEHTRNKINKMVTEEHLVWISVCLAGSNI